MYIYYVSDALGTVAQLAISAAARLLSEFSPSTLRQYHRMWADFLAFQAVAGLLHLKVTVQSLLSFHEYLHQNVFGTGQLSNYLTALRALYIVHGLETFPFRDERLPLLF